MKQKLGLPDIIIMLTLASTTLYTVSRNLPFGMGSFTFLWAPITLVFTTITRPIIYKERVMKTLLIYGIISVGILQYSLWKFMDSWNQIRILYEFYYLVVACAIFFYYYCKRDFRTLALLSKWTFILIIVSLITTNIALYFDPNLVRESARTGEFTERQARIFRLSGAMGYSYIQSVVCLIPILIYHIKNKQNMVFPPKILIAILLLIIITEIRSQVFANVIVTVIITILSIIVFKKKRYTIVAMLISCVLVITIPSSSYTKLFYSSSSYFDPDSEMYYKLTDFAEFVENPEFETSTGAGGRAERYPMLIEALSANPAFGNASYDSPLDIGFGAHLYWMNRLALWGVPGFLLFIFMLFRIFKKINSLFNSGYKPYYFLSIATFILLGLIKAIGSREPWLMLIVIIPGLYFSLPPSANNKKERQLEKLNPF
jgi:hypothetical protein